MPDWLRTTVWIVGVLALLLTLVIGYLMWRYRIPPRGLVAMGGAALYLMLPIDLVPEAILGPLGLIDDAGVVAAVVLFVYKLVKVRRILADGGVELGRPGRRPPRSLSGADRGPAQRRPRSTNRYSEHRQAAEVTDGVELQRPGDDEANHPAEER